MSPPPPPSPSPNSAAGNPDLFLRHSRPRPDISFGRAVHACLCLMAFYIISLWIALYAGSPFIQPDEQFVGMGGRHSRDAEPFLSQIFDECPDEIYCPSKKMPSTGCSRGGRVHPRTREGGGARKIRVPHSGTKEIVGILRHFQIFLHFFQKHRRRSVRFAAATVRALRGAP